jgi:hypothetical protein
VSSETDGLGDFPVVCVESGDVRVLSLILMTLEAGPADLKAVHERIYREGVAARVRGRLCPTCRQSAEEMTCEYRPLRGPLFVPR